MSKKVDNIDRQLLDALEQVGNPMMILDKDFQIIKVNEQQEKASQTSRNETLGKNFFEAYPTLAKPNMPHRKAFKKAVRTKKPVEFSAYSELLDRWVEGKVFPTNAGGVIIFWQDVTLRVRALEESESLRRLYEAIAGSTPDLIYVFDLNYHFTYANKALLEMWGVKSLDRAVGKGFRELGYEEWHAVMHEREIDQVVATKKEVRGVVTFPHATLGRRIYDYIFNPVFDSKGRVVAVTGTTRDITELKEAEEDRRRKLEIEQEMKLIKEQNNALKQINESKEEFIAVTSHQLRTPATAVKQYTGLLLSNFAGKLTDTQREFVQVAYDSNERQLAIINELIKAVDINGGNSPSNTATYDIVYLVCKVVAELSSTFDSRDQHVRLKTPKDKINLLIDVTDIRLAISNLIENASKYSYPHTTIDVELRSMDNHVEIIVHDEGVGISKDDAKKIFEKFTRVKNALSDTVPGNGFGLYLVHQIVKNHNGEIILDSEPGKGSTFTVRLPLQTDGAFHRKRIM